MASSESGSAKRRRDGIDQRSAKRRRDGIDQRNTVESRTRSTSNPASGRGDVRSVVQDAVDNGMTYQELRREIDRRERETGSKETPSGLGAYNGWSPHQYCNEPKYLCHRPQQAKPPVPVVLLFKPLSQFADNLNTIPIRDEDLAFAQKFWDDIHSKEYVTDHGPKVMQMVGDLEEYCLPSGMVMPSCHLFDGSILDGAGFVGNTHCMWLEYKAESGKSGDPYFQVLDYALRSAAGRRNALFQTYGIAICVSGPHLQTLAVTIVGEKVWADPLGIVQCYGEGEALEATARVWAAVRKFFSDYNTVPAEKYTAEPVPWPLNEYQGVERVAGTGLIYRYTNQQGKPELAKFVRRYCEEAHTAWKPHAPELRAAISSIVGHWRLVRMEYLSDPWCPVATILKGAEDPSEIAKKIGLSVLKVVKSGHALGFVHGDVRLPNILVREGAEKESDGLPTYQVKLLDYDWSGKSGEAKYPERLNTKIVWPAGAKYGALITQEHDEWFACHLEQQLK